MSLLVLPFDALPALRSQVAGASTVAASMAVAHALSSSAAGVSTATASMAVAHALASSAAGVSTVTGSMRVAHALQSAAAGASTVTATARVAHALASTAAGASTTAGSMRVAHALQSAVAGASTTTSSMRVTHALASSAAGVSTTTASMRVAHALQSTAAGASTVTGGTKVAHALGGTGVGVGAGAASETVKHTLAGTAAGASTVTDSTGVRHALASSAAGASSTSGSMAPSRGLASTAAGSSGVTGSGVITHHLACAPGGSGAAAGFFTALRPLAGVASGSGAGALVNGTFQGAAGGESGVTASMDVAVPPKHVNGGGGPNEYQPKITPQPSTAMVAKHDVRPVITVDLGGTMTEVLTGTRYRISAVFSAGKHPIDPADVSLVVTVPGEAPVAYHVGDELVRAKIGTYYVELVSERAGTTRYRWISSGKGQEVQVDGKVEIKEGTVDLQPDEVDDSWLDALHDQLAVSVSSLARQINDVIKGAMMAAASTAQNIQTDADADAWLNDLRANLSAELRKVQISL